MVLGLQRTHCVSFFDEYNESKFKTVQTCKLSEFGLPREFSLVKNHLEKDSETARTEAVDPGLDKGLGQMAVQVGVAYLHGEALCTNGGAASTFRCSPGPSIFSPSPRKPGTEG